MSDSGERSEQLHRAIDAMIRTARMHHRCIEKQFEDTGLHRSQRRMLMYLSHCESMPSQRQIADAFDISPACVARTLKWLASEGYIIRTGDEDDLRRNQVSITEKGLNTVNQTHQTFAQVDHAAFEGLTGEEIDRLIALVSRVQNNLRALEDNNSKGSAST